VTLMKMTVTSKVKAIVMKITVTTSTAWIVPHHSMTPWLMTLCTYEIHLHGSFQILLHGWLSSKIEGICYIWGSSKNNCLTLFQMRRRMTTIL
jgi:hypothetical protein